MIWDSVAAMTIIDMVVIGIIIYSLSAFHRNRVAVSRLGLVSSVHGIYWALILIGLFYFFDLLIMHVLPLFTSHSSAMQAMEVLHLNWSWVVFLVAVSVMSSMLVHMVRSVIPSVVATEELLLKSHNDLEGQVERRTQALQQEITGHREANAALRRSDDRYRSVVEDMPALICRFRPDGTLTFVNEQYCRYFNKTRSQLIGYNFFEFIPVADREEVRAHFSALTLEKPATTYEHGVIAPDGTRRWQRWTDRALFDEIGRAAEYQSLGEDITERKVRDQRLRESEERFRNLIEGSIQGIFVHRDYKLLFVNYAFAEILGYDSKDDLLANMKSIDEHHAPHERDRIRGYKDARLRGDNAPIRYEYDALRKDGAVVRLQNIVRVINWEGQRAIQCTVIEATGARRHTEERS